MIRNLQVEQRLAQLYLIGEQVHSQVTRIDILTAFVDNHLGDPAARRLRSVSIAFVTTEATALRRP